MVYPIAHELQKEFRHVRHFDIFVHETQIILLFNKTKPEAVGEVQLEHVLELKQVEHKLFQLEQAIQ